MESCCKIQHTKKKCIRSDKKIFSLPRKFTRKQCNNAKGFTMKSSCAPYKFCTKIKGECIAKLFPDKSIINNRVKGLVSFIQTKDKLVIEYEINGLSDGEHGFHVHRCGDITKSCKSGCEHFNPYNKKHGGLNDKNSHAGDLGNIISKNKKSKGVIETDKISIIPGKKNNIIGRMIIVHEDIDDLGKGGNAESEITGNAGRRLACGIIGIKSGI